MSSDSASATAALNTEPLQNSGGSHLELAAHSQTCEGYLVDRRKEDLPACSVNPRILALSNTFCEYIYAFVIALQGEYYSGVRIVRHFQWFLNFNHPNI